jgi:hypothetical protein
MKITVKNTPWLKKYRLTKGYEVVKRTHPLADNPLTNLVNYVIGGTNSPTTVKGVPVNMVVSLDPKLSKGLKIAGLTALGFGTVALVMRKRRS